MSAALVPTVAVVHRVYGPGRFHNLLPEAGQARVTFDGTPEFAAGKRRVLTKDLAPVRAGESERVTS